MKHRQRTNDALTRWAMDGNTKKLYELGAKVQLMMHRIEEETGKKVHYLAVCPEEKVLALESKFTPEEERDILNYLNFAFENKGSSLFCDKAPDTIYTYEESKGNFGRRGRWHEGKSTRKDVPRDKYHHDQRVQKLVEALEFYATEWESDDMANASPTEKLCKDIGKKSRKALAEFK